MAQEKLKPNNLGKYPLDPSAISAQLLGKVKTAISNGEDAYFMSVQKAYELCGLTKQLFSGYITQFSDYNIDKAIIQKSLLSSTTKKGIAFLVNAEQNLLDSNTNLLAASKDLASLNKQLEQQFNENSAYYKEKIKQLSSSWFNKKANQQRIREFQLQIKNTKAYFVNFGDSINSSYEIFGGSASQLSELIKDLKDVSAQLSAVQPEASITNQYQSIIVQSYQIIQKQCSVLSQNHK